MRTAPCHLEFEVAPYRLSGVVYGTLLNQEVAIAALAAAAHQPPYKAPAKSPVLYVKPRNTLAGHGDTVTVPADAPELEVGASLGIVIGRTACRVAQAEALEHVAGYTIVNDVSVPHDVFYRPSIRFKARDGSCPVGPAVVPRSAVSHPDALAVRVMVDGALVHSTTTGERRRTVARLLADVTEFMTLSPGDVLMLGVSAGAPRVRAGQQVRIEIEGLGQLDNRFVPEGAAQ
ncbi:fumarylacetoacetate hydrolase family protein [Xylophilus sp. ASV27]|uniref:fumarylacetoacetate hydrolase family protein n=1 Tax=Xylophilus sp. ASV27 TaxID=2795129 RepID=UPI0018ED96DB|nr:fumarylacetoacetate hydrolase family protein [Xylophilus sp. ASV27]